MAVTIPSKRGGLRVRVQVLGNISRVRPVMDKRKLEIGHVDYHRMIERVHETVSSIRLLASFYRIYESRQKKKTKPIQSRPCGVPSQPPLDPESGKFGLL